MLKSISLCLLSILLSASLSFAQSEKPRSADEILNESIGVAKASHKSVFVIFHASWCSWCKRLEKVLETPDVKKIIDEHFVIARIDVLEQNDKIEEFENPGGKELMKKFGGEKSGLPYYLFLNGSGKKIADSNALPGSQNIGYPGAPEEFTAFENLLKKSAKSITPDQLSVIIESIKNNLPKPQKK
jgi:thioredoxin-related protein